MATSKNSPTAAETSTSSNATPAGNAPESGDTPLMSEGQVSEDRAVEKSAQDNDDYRRQYPEPAEEAEEAEGVVDPDVFEETAKEADAEPGEVWAIYRNTNHTRGFTFPDQRRDGVAEDKLLDNTRDATPVGIEVSLAPGVYWSNANSHRVNITNYPPGLVLAIEADPNFEVKRY
jgi:hypothetical protein